MRLDHLPLDDRDQIGRVLRETDLVATSLQRIHGAVAGGGPHHVAAVEHIGGGGAMRVYRVKASEGHAERSFALKLVKSDRLATIFHRPVKNGAATGDDGRVEGLLSWMIDTTRRVNRAAPGIYPTFGGYWRLPGNGRLTRFLTEQFIEGPTLMDRRLDLEEELAAGRLDFRGYTDRRLALDRLTVAAFVRLWLALDRGAFSADPSPWNVKVLGEGPATKVVILDLHLLAEPAPPLLLFERFQALYGMRDEVVRQAILPGMADALGTEEMRSLLTGLQPDLEDLSRQSRDRVGADLYATLREAVEDWLGTGEPALSD